MTNISIKLELCGETRSLEIPSSSSLSFDDFLAQASRLYKLKTEEMKSLSFTYSDEDDDQILVSSSEEFADFLSFVKDSAATSTPITIELTLDNNKDRSDEVKELLKKVKEAVKADHSLAKDLREIVHDVLGPRPDHPRHFPPPPFPPPPPGCGRPSRGRHGGRPHRGRGPYDRHCRRDRGLHGHETDEECDHDFPPFPPPEHAHFPFPPPPHPHREGGHPSFPPPFPPPMWNVERVIREHWSPIPGVPPPPPPFHGPPGGRHHGYPHSPPPPHGRRRFPMPPPVSFAPHFPSASDFDYFHHPPPSRRRGHGHHYPPPPPPPPHHGPSCPAQGEEDDEEWEFEFERLRV